MRELLIHMSLKANFRPELMNKGVLYDLLSHKLSLIDAKFYVAEHLAAIPV